MLCLIQWSFLFKHRDETARLSLKEDCMYLGRNAKSRIPACIHKEWPLEIFRIQWVQVMEVEGDLRYKPHLHGIESICAQSRVPIVIRVSGPHLLRFLTPNSHGIYRYCPNAFATATKSKTLTTPSPLTSGVSLPNPLATATKSRMLTIPSSLTSCLSTVLLR